MKELIKLKADVINAIRLLMEQNGIVESYYNKITGGTGACENVPTAFILQNTPEVAYLSQTDQLSMEAEILKFNLSGVWTLGRSYRNEPRAGDGRHLAEFVLLEYESLGCDLNELTNFQQILLNTVMKVALESNLVADDHKNRLRRYLEQPAKIITYTEVLEILNNAGVSINWGDDFTSTIEEMICLFFNGPVQVTHYPESIKFFNMYRTDRKTLEDNLSIDEYNKRRYTVDCIDFLLPWAGETFGGSQREIRAGTLRLKLTESSMLQQMIKIRAEQINDGIVTDEIKAASLKPFESYLQLFDPISNNGRSDQQFTYSIRSGFGLGMGRLIQFLLGSTLIVPF
jgi:aspartyl/asparaginyl-tRNA synthetase